MSLAWFNTVVRARFSTQSLIFRLAECTGMSRKPGVALDLLARRWETVPTNRDLPAETAQDRASIGAKTVTLIISNCSKRKRVPVDPTLFARDLNSSSAGTVAEAWTLHLNATTPSVSASALYAGRAFFEARQTALDLGASLAVVSAGLGLVRGETSVPSYSLTTARGDPDDVLKKTMSGAADWWIALTTRSPFHSDALETETGPILAALSSSYVALLAADWAQWPQERQSRLRLFTKEEPTALPAGLRKAWMPYDDRLDATADGLAGTQSDFAQRALRHFAVVLGKKGGLDEDRASVREALDGLSARHIPSRTRASDGELQTAIRAHWDAVQGRSGAMLRHIRDDLQMACEQGRFRTLFSVVAAERKGGGR